jgi:hypothetical protein
MGRLLGASVGTVVVAAACGGGAPGASLGALALVAEIRGGAIISMPIHGLWVRERAYRADWR